MLRQDKQQEMPKAKRCFLLCTLQQDCDIQSVCRLFLVVKDVFVSFPDFGCKCCFGYLL